MGITSSPWFDFSTIWPGSSFNFLSWGIKVVENPMKLRKGSSSIYYRLIISYDAFLNQGQVLFTQLFCSKMDSEVCYIAALRMLLFGAIFRPYEAIFWCEAEVDTTQWCNKRLKEVSWCSEMLRLRICRSETRLQDLFHFLGSFSILLERCPTSCGTVRLCVGLLRYC